MRLAVLTVAMLLVAPAAATSLDRHDAKVRTFKALLHLTELPADSGDATHAAITVRGCVRMSFGFRCRGSLAPVAFSGIDGSTCSYVVYVSVRRTRVVAGDC